jgi:hypothetical protein
MFCSNCHKRLGYSNGWIYKVLADPENPESNIAPTSWGWFCEDCKDVDERDIKL